MLLCNDVSHWLGASLWSALHSWHIYRQAYVMLIRFLYLHGCTESSQNNNFRCDQRHYTFPIVKVWLDFDVASAVDLGACCPWWHHQMEDFPWLLVLCEGSRWPVDSPHKDQWRVALMFSSICAWVNNRDVGELRRHWAHYDVTVMVSTIGLEESYAFCRWDIQLHFIERM